MEAPTRVTKELLTAIPETKPIVAGFKWWPRLVGIDDEPSVGNDEYVWKDTKRVQRSHKGVGANQTRGDALQPIPQRLVKMMTSKKATYLESAEDIKLSKDIESAEETPAKKEGPKEPHVAPESCSETSSATQNPPPLIPDMLIPLMHVGPSSPTTLEAPPKELVPIRVPPS
ncbi:hypothetical protein ACLOJK_025973 [Asimina triloba]